MGKKSKSKNTPKPTAQEIALAASAKKKWDLYKRAYQPLHKELLKKTQASPAKRAIARGMASSDIQQANKRASGSALGAGLAAGFSGDSSRNILTRGRGAAASGALSGASAARASRAVDTRDLQGRVNFARIGLGVAGQTLQSQSQLARNANALAMEEAANETSAVDNVAAGIGAFAGMAGPGAFSRTQQPVGTVSSGIGTGGTFNYVNNSRGFVGGF